jgi:predicted nucleic acid-binding protein
VKSPLKPPANPPVGVLHVAEPPAHFQVRTPIVVDCSVVAAWVFHEAWMDQAASSMSGHDLIAPHLIQNEMASVAVKKSRRGHGELAEAGIDRFMELAIELHPVQADAVFDLARQFDLTGYDASYLWLAAHLKCPLATFDDRLGAAARIHLASLG